MGAGKLSSRVPDISGSQLSEPQTHILSEDVDGHSMGSVIEMETNSTEADFDETSDVLLFNLHTGKIYPIS